MGHPRPLFRLFSVFCKQTTQIFEQINVGPGFELTTLRLFMSLLFLLLDQGSRPAFEMSFF